MTENITKAFDATNEMEKDCQSKIDELKALKEVYQQIVKSEEYKGKPDNALYDLNQYVKCIQEHDYSLPIRGIFALASQFPTENNIETAIKSYQDAGNYWIKIREQLGKE